MIEIKNHDFSIIKNGILDIPDDGVYIQIEDKWCIATLFEINRDGIYRQYGLRPLIDTEEVDGRLSIVGMDEI